MLRQNVRGIQTFNIVFTILTYLLFPPKIHQAWGISEAYAIDRLLGSGNFGQVYRARGKCDGQVRAIKVFEKLQLRRNYQRIFNNEVEMHKALPPHPNVVAFYGAFEDEERGKDDARTLSILPCHAASPFLRESKHCILTCYVLIYHVPFQDT